jgi:hypothetical protein
MNDKILIDRAVVEQALEALEDVFRNMKTSAWFDSRVDALRASLGVDALRAALEQPEQCAHEDDCTSMPWCRIRARGTT